MRHLILAAFGAAFLLSASPANSQACDPYDEGIGWMCDSRGFFAGAYVKKRVVKRTVRHHRHTVKRRGRRSARGVHPKLMGAYRHVRARCKGVRVVSGVRRTYVRGYRRRVRSLHWDGNAFDFRANSYVCAYRALRSFGWRWGMSRDGRRCSHIHISYGGRFSEPHGFRHRRC